MRWDQQQEVNIGTFVKEDLLLNDWPNKPETCRLLSTAIRKNRPAWGAMQSTLAAPNSGSKMSVILKWHQMNGTAGLSDRGSGLWPQTSGRVSDGPWQPQPLGLFGLWSLCCLKGKINTCSIWSEEIFFFQTSSGHRSRCDENGRCSS